MRRSWASVVSARGCQLCGERPFGADVGDGRCCPRRPPRPSPSSVSRRLSPGDPPPARGEPRRLRLRFCRGVPGQVAPSRPPSCPCPCPGAVSYRFLPFFSAVRLMRLAIDLASLGRAMRPRRPIGRRERIALYVSVAPHPSGRAADLRPRPFARLSLPAATLYSPRLQFALFVPFDIATESTATFRTIQSVPVVQGQISRSFEAAELSHGNNGVGRSV